MPIRRWAVALALSVLLVVRVAVAADGTAPSRAEVLYEEGIKLLVDGRTADACARFVESRKLEEGIGVTLYLGDCYDRLGRSASAWSIYAVAEDLARQRNDPRADVAAARRQKLEPRLRRVLVRGASEISVSLDGEIIASDRLRAPLPVDPGAHLLEAKASGRIGWQHRFDALAEGATLEITIPPLEPIVPAIAEPPPRSPQRAVAVTTGALGLGAIAVGSVFGGLALSKRADSNDAGCAPDNRCPPAAAALRDDARDRATVSTVGFVIGAALLTAGIVLFVTAPSSARSK